MKTLFKNIGVLALTVLALASCKKDEDIVTVTSGDTPSLTVSTNAVSLSKDHATDTVVSFSWNEYELKWSTPAYGTNIAKYTLQIDSAGKNFSSTYDLDFTGATIAKFTAADLNNILANKFKYATGVSAHMEARLKATLASNASPVYSNVVSFTATPYLDIPDYPSIYVVGGFQGWDPASAPKISSPESNSKYEGYVYFSAASEFKFTSARDWSHTNYGAADAAGSLSTDGGAGNLKIADAGYYLLKADITALTYTATKVTWGVIGDATGSWDVDQPMVYNASTNLWTTTISLSAGELKFRANGGWDLNYGKGSSDGVLKAGGDNIKVTEAGSYKITLNLSHPGYYLYELTKQ